MSGNREKAPLSDVAISIGVLRHELGMTSTPSDSELIRCSPINGCGQLNPAVGCMACYQRARRINQRPAENRRANLCAKYRVTPEQYDALRAEQGYRCGICGISEADVDLTGLAAVRALMVNRCSRFRSP
ncbi:hypothetical protein MINTM021_24770 [Mycobacterium paraintracellulare]|nr:hypothetical protein MINTM021_24770 [Mycobacterium paraintracellulare]